MSGEGSDRSLSGKFADSAKDDPKAVQEREREAVNDRLLAYGEDGRKVLAALDRQTERDIEAQIEQQITNTAEQRAREAIRARTQAAGGIPEPGRSGTAPLSPAQHQKIMEVAAEATARQNAELEERIRFEAIEARNQIGTRQADRMEGQQRGRSLDRGRGMGDEGL